MNPIMFRTSDQDEVDILNTWFVFEVLVYVQSGKKSSAQEFTCGWAKASINVCQQKKEKMKL
jgi:hypothetical protein